MSREELLELGRGNVEAHADWDEESSPDEIYDRAYTLAFDKMIDTGADRHLVAELATEIGQSYAHP